MLGKLSLTLPLYLSLPVCQTTANYLDSEQGTGGFISTYLSLGHPVLWNEAPLLRIMAPLRRGERNRSERKKRVFPPSPACLLAAGLNFGFFACL